MPSLPFATSLIGQRLMQSQNSIPGHNTPRVDLTRITQLIIVVCSKIDLVLLDTAFQARSLFVVAVHHLPVLLCQSTLPFLLLISHSLNFSAYPCIWVFPKGGTEDRWFGVIFVPHRHRQMTTYRKMLYLGGYELKMEIFRIMGLF